jgi:hypothetical protein
MSTITIHIPTSEVGWFEQMVHSMGWKFTKTDVSKEASSAERQVITPALRRRINKARKEYAERQTITCKNPQEMQQFFDSL